MKFKNINPVERFFEKGVVLVALGASFYFIYNSYLNDPNIVGATNSKPGEIEAVVSDNLRIYDEVVKHDPAYVFTPVKYVQDYVGGTKDPLPPNLLTPAPVFAPVHLAIQIGPDTGTGPQLAPIALPTVPPLGNLAISSGRTVATIPAAGGIAAVPRRDMTYVKGTADLDMATLDAGVKNINLPLFQKTAIYRVHVQRAELQADGSWSPWADSKPLPINPLPVLNPAKITAKDLPEVTADLRQKVKVITEPDFYPPAEAVVPTAPVTPTTPTPPKTPTRTPPRATPTATPRRGAEVRPGRTPPPGYGTPQPQGFTPPQAPPQGIAPPGAGPVDVNMPSGLAAGDDFFGLNAGAPVPVWFWDDQVLPEHTYKYQARVEIINPLYQLPKGLQTIPPQGKNALFLPDDPQAGWTAFAAVTVEADEYYFLTPDNLTAHAVASASFKVYKWHEGQWYAVEDRVEPGMTVGGMRKVPRPGLTPVQVNFGAVYTVIDIRPTTTPAGVDVQVVLLDNTTGRLVLRDLLSDGGDIQRQKLDDIIRKQNAPPVSAGPALGSRAE